MNERPHVRTSALRITQEMGHEMGRQMVRPLVLPWLAFGAAAGISIFAGCSSTESSSGGSMQLPIVGLGHQEFIVMDPQGNATVVWNDKDTQLWWGRVSRGGGLSASVLLEPSSFGAGFVHGDRDGNLTVDYMRGTDPQKLTHVLRRYIPVRGWSDVPVPAATLGSIDTGYGGQLITVLRNTDVVAQKEQIIVQRYAPASGWSTADILEEVSGLVHLGTHDAAIYADGSALVTWAHNDRDAPLVFERFVPGTGWTGVKTSDVILSDVTSRLLSDGLRGAMLLTDARTGPPTGGAEVDDPYTVTSRSFGADALGAAQIVAVDAVHLYASAMGANGAAIVAWRGKDRVRAHYFSPSSGWRQIDVPNSDPAGTLAEPLVAIDGQGRALVVWGTGIGNRGYNAHVSFARYDPVSGWGAGAQIDSDGAAFFGPLSMNAVGDAMLIWAHDVGGPDTEQSTQWISVLP